ncbi:MAG: response regulator [Fibrobacter sp.]|nr:response regulator [Fibrobacter sp.]
MTVSHNKTILIADDDRISIKLAEFVLQKDGYDIVTVNSGEACIEYLKKEHSVDLVLLDIEMPELNGIETLERIRADESIADTKVFFLTGNEFSRYEDVSRRLDVLDFISKPVYGPEILERINKVFANESANVRDTVLVVDDDRMNLKFAEHMLSSTYNVILAQDYQETLNSLSMERPSLVLLDVHMPGMNGFELLSEIRKIKACSDLPVVFLTADSDRETEVRVFREGAQDYIQKPFVPEVVLERIKRILSLRKLQVSLESEVDRRTAELEESRRKHEILSLQVVKTLASAIDAKDRYTNGHSSRVAKYSKEIALRAGKSIEYQDEIYFVALLHDIGKIGIPDNILNKNSKLTDEEYETIKQHPSIGVEILRNITEMPNIEIGAHYHHERFDGKGYPEGLAGYEIPEIARIIAVADAYDAMSSRRSYRAALPQNIVREEIVKGRGYQFDPAFADVMLKMIDEDVRYEMCDDGLTL